jgi:hypothetical protein
MADILRPELNPRQLKFARLVAGGSTQTAAYTEAYGHDGAGRAAKLAARPAVAAEIERLQHLSEEACELDREDLIRYLVNVIRTPVGELHPDHPLTQELIELESKDTTRRRVKGVCKLGAAKLLCGILGWLRTEKVEKTGDRELTIYLKKMWEEGPPIEITGSIK